MAFSKNEHSNSVKCLIYKRKTAVFIPAVCIGDPNGIVLNIAFAMLVPRRSFAVAHRRAPARLSLVVEPISMGSNPLRYIH